ncbi:MAG: site-specific DNA-methyltransferase, partial [Treponema sp.]|nr:site-specific DNA-methyltransferase [Treponema sp.]
MSTNISKQKREDLIYKIEEIRKYLKNNLYDENAQKLMGYLNELTTQINGQKYGLVFEEHREKIDETLEEHLPVLTEEKDLFVGNGGEMNFLLEGDNLASLQLLEKTHKGKIDVIYIDPPYNTGNKDFIYDDDFVDSADSFRHSKWCSFISKRLEIAKLLLKDDGFIFISIDDNELADLRMVCNEIFGDENFVANLPTVMNLKGNQDEYGFAGTHEYTLVYARNKSVGKLGQFIVNENELESWEEDD